MRECLVCGAEIEKGTHHESTTTCIRNLRLRIEALERRLAPPAPPVPLPPIPPS